MSANTNTIEDRRIDGMYGEVWHEGRYQGDILEISGRIAIERREIPRAGTNQIVYRRGRVSREGSFRVGKIDSRWEEFVLEYAGQSPDEIRDLRSQGIAAFPETHFIIRLDDPDSWGAEELQLLGVRIWELPIGYGGNDLVERELPFSWEQEKLLQGVPRPHNSGNWSVPVNPRTGQNQTWGAAGDDPVI